MRLVVPLLGSAILIRFIFTTIHTRPLLAFSSPADDAVDVAVGKDISLYFDELVTIGTGNITISNGVDIRTIDIRDSNQVMFDGYSGGN